MRSGTDVRTGPGSRSDAAVDRATGPFSRRESDGSTGIHQARRASAPIDRCLPMEFGHGRDFDRLDRRPGQSPPPHPRSTRRALREQRRPTQFRGGSQVVPGGLIHSQRADLDVPPVHGVSEWVPRSCFWRVGQGPETVSCQQFSMLDDCPTVPAISWGFPHSGSQTWSQKWSPIPAGSRPLRGSDRGGDRNVESSGVGVRRVEAAPRMRMAERRPLACGFRRVVLRHSDNFSDQANWWLINGAHGAELLATNILSDLPDCVTAGRSAGYAGPCGQRFASSAGRFRACSSAASRLEPGHKALVTEIGRTARLGSVERRWHTSLVTIDGGWWRDE